MSRIRTSLRISWTAIFVCIFVTALSAHSQNSQSQNQPAQDKSAQSQNPPQTTPPSNKIDGAIGACTADFTVHDGENKPIYNAKISVELRYGFLNKRKTDLQIGTDSNGKAQFTGLPNFPKKPLEFTIKTGTVSKTVTDDPNNKCNATFDVVFAVR